MQMAEFAWTQTTPEAEFAPMGVVDTEDLDELPLLHPRTPGTVRVPQPPRARVQGRTPHKRVRQRGSIRASIAAAPTQHPVY